MKLDSSDMSMVVEKGPQRAARPSSTLPALQIIQLETPKLLNNVTLLFLMALPPLLGQPSNEEVRKDGCGKGFRFRTLSLVRITEEADGKVVISGDSRQMFSRESSWEYNRYVLKSGSLGSARL